MNKLIKGANLMIQRKIILENLAAKERLQKEKQEFQSYGLNLDGTSFKNTPTNNKEPGSVRLSPKVLKKPMPQPIDPAKYEYI